MSTDAKDLQIHCSRQSIPRSQGQPGISTLEPCLIRDHFRWRLGRGAAVQPVIVMPCVQGKVWRWTGAFMDVRINLVQPI